MKTYMGLDLGSKSLGIAISNSGIIASTYDTFYFKEDDYEEAIKIMVELLKKEKVETLVIGLPKHMHNELGERGVLSNKFGEDLKALYPIEVIMWDERSSTKSAIKTMIQAGTSRKKQKQKKDEVAAVIILQNYLDYKENNK